MEAITRLFSQDMGKNIWTGDVEEVPLARILAIANQVCSPFFLAQSIPYRDAFQLHIAMACIQTHAEEV